MRRDTNRMTKTQYVNDHPELSAAAVELIDHPMRNTSTKTNTALNYLMRSQGSGYFKPVENDAFRWRAVSPPTKSYQASCLCFKERSRLGQKICGF